MSTVHMIVGNTGAGKTTYAIDLAQQRNCIRYSIDEWMESLFEADKSDAPTYEWMLERVNRIQHQMLKMVAQHIRCKQDVILDLGFFTKKQRNVVRSSIASNHGNVRMHYLDIDAAIRWERVQKRNTEQGETYALQVTREVFDFCETLFEVPGETELEGALIVRV
ncbi:MAG: ATP-binding protein [Phycisphaeraceae bacterium]|nr:ATP-binding protein [Phycisphaerales bacterium]MCB9859356.1 ATP-binding protein [Phycisphaeraceae bacterium]